MRGLRLGSVFGIEIGIDSSWFITVPSNEPADRVFERLAGTGDGRVLVTCRVSRCRQIF